MATTIKIKSSSVPSKVPDASSLQPAELAINLKDQKLYSKDVDGVVFEVGKDADVDLGYTPAADKGTVTNTAGDDAELPLADGTNAGLLAPGDKDKLDEITIGGGGGLEIAGYVKTDDGGTQQSITGGGGLDVAGGITNEFGTSSAQLGNVAPLNDWSCYPARTTTYSAPPKPPAPAPEPVDPEFGIDEPTNSAGMTGSAGIVITQDIIDLEGE